jgi:hypothetical protein
VFLLVQMLAGPKLLANERPIRQGSSRAFTAILVTPRGAGNTLLVLCVEQSVHTCDQFGAQDLARQAPAQLLFTSLRVAVP